MHRSDSIRSRLAGTTFLWILAAGLGGVSNLRAAEARVPAGPIPVMREVDVLVVGGSAGGVEAALSAARAGARVFVVAPRPYLGDDLCASYRLWLEPGETPATDLARTVFAPVKREAASTLPGYRFRYTASRPSAARHPDREGSKLIDGRYGQASTDSVEFNDPVTIRIDLEQARPIRDVTVLAYQRPLDFEISTLTAATSQDGQAWTGQVTVTNQIDPSRTLDLEAFALVCPLSANARYVQLTIRPTPRVKRLLLGEILVHGAGPVPAASPSSAPQPVPPMQVKRALDQALLAAGIPFLYPTFATELLTDARGQPAGIVMANRSGRQAVIAKTIIDTTERATVARMTRARFSPVEAGSREFARLVVDGPARQGSNLELIPHDPPLLLPGGLNESHHLFEYRLRLPLADAGFPALAQAEQISRDLTWTVESTGGSETLFEVPPDSFRSAAPFEGQWPGADALPLGCLQPDGVDRLYVLGGCADLPRAAAARLVRPVNLMAVGARLGTVAARQALGSPAPADVALAARPAQDPVPGQVAEVNTLLPARATSRTVAAGESALPIWGDYDVVVVGGGTGGAPAGIGAGRQGAKTLLLEFTHALGGVGTEGLISKYYYGRRVGFTTEVDQGVAALEQSDPKRNSSGSWRPEVKSEYYRRELRRAGVDIWFGVMGHGALVDHGRVTGVVVVTPLGRGVVRAKTVIDSTGNADIAAAAGAICRYTDDTEVAVQGTGLPPRDPGARYVNTDYTFVDETDIVDIWRAFVMGRQKFERTYDLGQLVDTRERRQVLGDYSLTPMDILLKRTFPDTVVIPHSNFDSHGYTVHSLFLLRPPDREGLDAHVPLRCLIPRGLDGIFVTGLGVSAHRDALPIIRMQPDIQNQGYAVGVAAAMLARTNTPTRDLDVKALQAHLVRIGNLPGSVLTNRDSFPLSPAQFAAAADQVKQDYTGLDVLLTDPDQAKPLLRARLESAPQPAQKLIYAHILGMLEDASGAALLKEAVRTTPWDQGWAFRGMGQFGPSLSRVDSYIVALGRTRSPEALPVLLEKAARLTPESEFSHFRALALALECLGDKSAAKPLADLLRQPGVSGHALTDIPTKPKEAAGQNDNIGRDRELRELVLARALYRCGDFEGLGANILQQYARSLQGHYARHAQAVLAAPKPAPEKKRVE